MAGLDVLKVSGNEVLEQERDVIGGNTPLATDVYGFTCEYLYIDQTDSGALMVYGSFKEDVSGKSIRYSECVMSKKSGTLKKTYTDRNGDEKLLVGYTRTLALIHSMGIDAKDLSEIDVEPRTLKLYDKDAKGETDQEKNTFIDAMGAKVQAAVYNVVETKMDKDEDGKYTVPTSEERAYNEFIKFFHADGRTNLEVTNNEEPAFRDEWVEAHKGKLRDKRSKDAPKAGAPKAKGAPVAKKAPLKFT